MSLICLNIQIFLCPYSSRTTRVQLQQKYLYPPIPITPLQLDFNYVDVISNDNDDDDDNKDYLQKTLWKMNPR
mgnify:CR=1 FL=1